MCYRSLGDVTDDEQEHQYTYGEKLRVMQAELKIFSKPIQQYLKSIACAPNIMCGVPYSITKVIQPGTSHTEV